MTPNSDGYDISHWNTIVATPPPFRILAHKATEGTASDPLFASRWHLFDDQHTEIMCPYHFLRSTSPIAKQLDNFTQVIGNAGALDRDGVPRQGVLLMTDWEPLSNGVVVIDQVPVDVALEWNAAVKARFGDREITYGSDWKVDFKDWRKAMPVHPLWYANYHLDGPNGFWAECDRYGATIGQWTNNAHVPGFTDGIDMNHVFDWAAVRRLAGYPQPLPPTEDTMTLIVNSEPCTFEGVDYPANFVKWALMPDGTKRHILTPEFHALGSPDARPLSNADLDAIPNYAAPLTATSLLPGTMGVSGTLGVTFR